jgi:hypothetical protein
MIVLSRNLKHVPLISNLLWASLMNKLRPWVSSAHPRSQNVCKASYRNTLWRRSQIVQQCTDSKKWFLLSTGRQTVTTVLRKTNISAIDMAGQVMWTKLCRGWIMGWPNRTWTFWSSHSLISDILRAVQSPIAISSRPSLQIDDPKWVAKILTPWRSMELNHGAKTLWEFHRIVTESAVKRPKLQWPNANQNWPPPSPTWIRQAPLSLSS